MSLSASKARTKKCFLLRYVFVVESRRTATAASIVLNRLHLGQKSNQVFLQQDVLKLTFSLFYA